MSAGRDATYAVRVAKLPDAKSLPFKSIQTYSDGREDGWIELPLADGSPPPMPAPVLVLTPAPATTTASTGSPTAAATTTAPAATPSAVPSPSTGAAAVN